MVTNDGTRFPQRDDLSMRGWIVTRQIPIPSSGDHLSRAHHYRAHRNFARLQRPLGCPQCFFHKELIGSVMRR